MASLFSHTIGLPPIVAHGSEALKRRIVPDVLRRREDRRARDHRAGRRLRRRPAAPARARRDGDDWVIDGEKTFITSGMRADWITLAVRTGEHRAPAASR